jgi:hypothetical protein
VRAVDFLNCRSLGLDEARLAVNVASRSWLGLLRPLDLDQSAPPLFLWGERLVFQLLGHNDCGLRLLPVMAGTAVGLLTYPLALRFLTVPQSRLAAMIAVLCPLLITYSNAVKQYSAEALVAVLLLLLFEKELRREPGPRAAWVLVAGALAPWISLSGVFVLVTAWVILSVRAVRLAAWSAAVWGVSGALAYVTVYRAAGRSPYLQRFWELAFVTPGRPGFVERAWKSLEDQVWAFVAGDPLIERGAYLPWLHLSSAFVLVAYALGCRWVIRTQGLTACWWLAGPAIVTLIASAAGVFPLSPRLTLYLLPALIVLFVAGIGCVIDRADRGPRSGLAVAGVALVLPLAAVAVSRTFTLEPSRHFEGLVRQLEEHRRAREPVYIFARTLPAWIYYTTDWADPDTARLRFLTRAAGSTGGAFENAPSRGGVRAEELPLVSPTAVTPGELLGLPSGMEWREVEEHVRDEPDSGWVETERRRIVEAADPVVWVLATAWYAAEAELFAALERSASRRTFARIRGGSALVRYEFGRASADDAGAAETRQSQSPATFGRRSTAASAGK